MRIAVYAETSLLEAIARDPSLKDSYVSSYSFHFVLGKGDEPPAPVEGKWCCGEFELKLPSRDTAVMHAQKALNLEAAQQARYYQERLANLLALTYDAAEGSAE